MPFINCSTPQLDQIVLSLVGNPNDTLPANATNVQYTVLQGGGSIASDIYSETGLAADQYTIEIERKHDIVTQVSCPTSFDKTFVSTQTVNGVTTATVEFENLASNPLTISSNGTSTVIPVGGTVQVSGISINQNGTVNCPGGPAAEWNPSCVTEQTETITETDICVVDVQSNCDFTATITGCPTGDISIPTTLGMEALPPTGQTHVAGPYWVGGATLNGLPYTYTEGTGPGAFNPIIDQAGDYCFKFQAELSGGGTNCGECCFTAIDAVDFELQCPTTTITDPKSQVSLPIADPDPSANREYVVCVNDCPMGAAVSNSPFTSNAISSYVPSGYAGPLNIEAKYFENGNRCNNVVGDSCQLNIDTTSCNHAYTDPIQVTDNGPTSGPYLRHWYATRSAFNADSSLIVLQESTTESQTVANTQKIFDLSGNFVMTLPTINRDVVWSRFDPDVIYGVRLPTATISTHDFICYNISTNTTDVIYSQSSYFQIGPKSALSYDDRCVAISNSSTMSTLDICTGEIVGTKSNTLSFPTIGTLLISPKGTYVLAIEPDTTNGGNSLFRYDKDFGNRTLLTTNAQHSDVSLDHNYNEVTVHVGTPPQMVDIVTGVVTPLDTGGNGGSNGHVSGNGQPGQFVYSATFFGDRQVLEVNSADGSNAVTNGIQWADLGNYNATSYRGQRKVTVSPDGCHIIYTEGPDGSNEHDEYIVTRSCA